MEDNFLNNTLPNNYFIINKIEETGACCYKSILLQLKIFFPKLKSNLNSSIIQSKAYNWIINNQYTYIKEFDSTIQDLIFNIHDLTFKEYKDLYKNYSGKEYTNVENDRWGGIPEIIALSNIYKVNICVYIVQSYSLKKNKIINGTIINNKLNKNGRFKLLYCTSNNESNDEYNNTINLLWRKKNNIDHFDSLLKSTV